MVNATSPAIVLPCDDTAFRLLAMLVQTPPATISATAHLRLASLVRQSLGDPAYYQTGVDKTLLTPAADALGIRVPRHRIARSVDDATAFASTLDYPVVVKRGYGFGGDNVAICADADELARAFAAIARPAGSDIDGAERGQVLVQAHIPGVTQYYSVAAWGGRLLAGFANDMLMANPWPKGPATVVRLHRSPDVRRIAERLVDAFGMSGMLSVECKIHEQTSEPYLLEINRRFGPSTFRGGLIGVDLCAALYAAINGLPGASGSDLSDDDEFIRVNFPQEWLRDPESAWLRDYPADVPWDEPELIEAMVAMRHES
jgi:predicted ATP-grasp superfamily ATP-dependent carboligase